MTFSESQFGKREDPTLDLSRVDPALFTASDEPQIESAADVDPWLRWLCTIATIALAAYVVYGQAWGFQNPGKTKPNITGAPSK